MFSMIVYCKKSIQQCIATHQGHVLMLYVLGMNGSIQNGSSRAPGSTNVSTSRYSVDM